MWLVIESGPKAGRSARIEGQSFTIGSAAGSDLRVEHADVDPHHATIVIGRDGHIEVRDEGSREGVFVEGERVTEPVPLNGDEKLRLGNDVLLKLSLEQPLEERTVEVPVRRWRAIGPVAAGNASRRQARGRCRRDRACRGARARRAGAYRCDRRWR